MKCLFEELCECYSIKTIGNCLSVLFVSDIDEKKGEQDRQQMKNLTAIYVRFGFWFRSRLLIVSVNKFTEKQNT